MVQGKRLMDEYSLALLARMMEAERPIGET